MSEEAVARVRALLDKLAMDDPRWSGQVFLIERGAFTNVAFRENDPGLTLLEAVHQAIRGDAPTNVINLPIRRTNPR